MPRWIVLLVLGFVVYYAWRKYGNKFTGLVTKITS